MAVGARNNACPVRSPGPVARGLPEVRFVFEGSADAAMLTDAQGRILYVNPGFTAMTGYAYDEAVGRTPALLKSGLHSQEFYQSLWRTLRAGSEFRGAFINRRRSGELFHENESIWPLADAQGRITHYLSTGRDISESALRTERLMRAATHDGLTDVPIARCSWTGSTRRSGMRGVPGKHSPWPSSTSIGSRRSTTRSATRQATRC